MLKDLKGLVLFETLPHQVLILLMGVSEHVMAFWNRITSDIERCSQVGTQVRCDFKGKRSKNIFFLQYLKVLVMLSHAKFICLVGMALPCSCKCILDGC